ncbi:MAG: GTP cyclohydrolase I FolE [Defluviitaleaceae bacterium]|nr:GTP cyclohydrolase I FolE [Defluviitaleaceae bacterium]
MIDVKKIEQAMTMLIEALGDDPSRPGLIDTPTRAAKMYAEMFEGMAYTNSQIAQKFAKCFEESQNNDWVLVKDINIFSYCEHHLALMYNMKVHVAYRPNQKVIGLSKIARIADMVSKRLQLQERITSDISEILSQILNTKDIMVILEGEHSCMNARGIKAQSAKTRTVRASGVFAQDGELKRDVLNSI